MKTLLSRRAVFLVCLLLLALFLVRPGAGRLRGRVSQSISQALGRRVEIGSVHLRFLPRPGFEFENLVIHDDAAFGAEPLLRSPNVTAWLRIIPFLRGRIEIASLSLSEASLNLTRGQQGHWNLEDLLERAARVPTAPTAAQKMESRPAFPYIEASRARINFKIGTEKTHFALTDAQFALWQESENAWGMRLKAQPIRTDANLTDTGVIDVTGMWRRSPVLHETPVQFSFEWRQAQIGQASKLFYGSDKRWRGKVILTGALVGTPGELRVSADASVDDFRRDDVLGGGSLRLVAHCAAQYSAFRRILSNVDCHAPVGDGALELKGSASGLPFSSYDFRLTSTKVPAQAALALVRHARTGVPEDLEASGGLNATLQLSRGDLDQHLQIRGDGEALELRLRSSNAGSEIPLGRVPFSLVPEASNATAKAAKTHVAESASSVGDSQLEIGPVDLVLGRPLPLRARASLSLSGYRVAVRGDAGLKKLLQSARMLGIPTPAFAADGSSTVDLTIAGAWRGPQPPEVLGTGQLHAVRAEVRGLNAPLEIASANLILDEDSVRVLNLNASAAQAIWRGSMQVSRPCVAPGACRFQFNLRSPELDAAALNELVNPSARKQSWYRFLARGDTRVPYLLQATAAGRIAVDKLVLGKSACTQFTADLDLHGGQLRLANLSGHILGGRATGEWTADFSARPPVYNGGGSFDGVSLTEIAELTHDSWIDGTGAAKYEFKTSGWGLADLLDSGDLTANFAISDGSFPHISLTSKSGALHASSFSGRILLRDGQFSFQDAKLDSSSGVYKVSGTVLLTGAMNLKMAGESASGFVLSGTLLKTRVSARPVTAAQAALKP